MYVSGLKVCLLAHYLMAEWLGRASQRHEMYCHDLEVMGSNPGSVELGVRGTGTWCLN